MTRFTKGIVQGALTAAIFSALGLQVSDWQFWVAVFAFAIKDTLHED